MPYFKRENVKIYYKWDYSTNPNTSETLVFINGTGLDIYSWNPILPYLLKHYHVFRYDVRGHGKSDSGNQKRTVELLSDDLKKLLNTQDMGPFHIISQGLGGFIGVQLAFENYLQLQTLTLIGVPLQYPEKLGKKIINERKRPVMGEPNMEKMGKELVKRSCLNLTKEKEDILLNAYRKITPEVYFDLFHTGFGKVATRQLQNIKLPILLLTGSEDEIFPPELIAASLNFNPAAKFYTVPQASFLVQMDQPELVANWLHQFIVKSKNQVTNEYKKNLTSEMYSEIRGMFSDEKHEKYNQLEVNIMQGFSVRINGTRIHEGWGKRKAKQILLYLVIQQSTTRDDLCDVFWPDVDLSTGRNRLRVSLHHLSQLLNQNQLSESVPILRKEREHIYLQANIQSDLVQHMSDIRKANNITHPEEKMSLYREILRAIPENPLPGLYEEWFLNQRSWIEEAWGEIAIILAEWYEKRKEVQKAIHYLELAQKYHIDATKLSKRLLAILE